jgi:hypothetical protein
MAPALAPLFTAALSDPPAQLKRGATILLAKGGGSSRDPGKYRPITLLPYMQRLLATIIDRVLRAAAAADNDIQISATQAGFVPGRGCHEQALLFHLLRADAELYQTPLHAVLLDIAKAFDSLDHGQLLRIMEEIGFKPPYLELVRRMLQDCTTELGGAVLELMRGAPQGSPCSPFLAVIYFESLARVVRAYVQAHPHGAPETAERLGLAAQDTVLVVLLQFADDTTLLGTSRAWLEGLLTAITQWADRCRLQFHAGKSSITAMSGKATRDRAPVSVQGHPIPDADVGKILGVPFAGARGSTAQAQAHTVAGIHGSMAKVRSLFRLRRRAAGRPDEVMVDFAILRTAILQVVLPRALYAAPVIEVDSDAIDRCLRKELKALLGLPSTFSSDALHWLLRLYPTEHEVAMARLKLAWRCYHQYWAGKAIRHLLAERRTYHPLLTTGPLGLLTWTLRRYNLQWADLEDQQYAPSPTTPSDDQSTDTPAPLADQPGEEAEDVDVAEEDESATAVARDGGFKAWRTLCRDRVDQGIAEWAVRAGRGVHRQSPLKHHFPSTAEQARSTMEAGLPLFLREGGDFGRAGLRLLAPRFGSGILSTEPCVLCGSGPSTPAHLLQCTGLPPDLKERRTYSNRARAENYRANRDSAKAGGSMRKQTARVNPKDWLETGALHMYWPSMTSVQLTDHLRWIGHAIDAWCTKWKQTNVGQGPQVSWRGVPPLVGLHE